MLSIKYRDPTRPDWTGLAFAATLDEALQIKARLEAQGFIVDMPVSTGPVKPNPPPDPADSG